MNLFHKLGDIRFVRDVAADGHAAYLTSHAPCGVGIDVRNDDHFRAGRCELSSESSPDPARSAGHHYDSISYFHDGSASLRRVVV
jgi:hypothetical protein